MVSESPTSPKSLLSRVHTISLSLVAAIAFAGQQVLQRLNDEHGVGSASTIVGVTLGCFLLALLIGCDMYVCRDKSAANWYWRYKATPGMLASQFTVLACFWVFNFDIVGLIFFWGCQICKDFRNPTEAVIYKYTFWSHVAACIPIALMGPLQFFEKLRKSYGFALHRWFGRIIFVDSLVHQGTVSGLVSMGMLNSGDWPSRLYYSALGVLNIYAWVSIIVGWPAGVRKNIPTHGACMHRLGAMWFAIVVAFRVFRPIAGAISEVWASAIAGWAVVFFCIFTTEIYLARSGRFDPVAPLPQARCPFTASQ